MAGIATIRGTAIAPGVSRNRRLYTRQMLGRAVERAQAAIARGEPHTMLTHHGAEDDSTRIVGRVTRLQQEDDGRVTFEAEIADTAHGRDIAALVTGDRPFLDGVSIRGAWRGPVRRVEHDGQTVETADDLDLYGLDFTKTPGVLAARIEPGAAAAETAETALLVYESVTEATAAKVRAPYGAVAYADLGVRDGVKRLPIDTRAHALQSWRALAENATGYTPQQLKRIRPRVRAALTRFGVPMETTHFGDVTEFYGDMPGADGGGFCIDAYNGPMSISLRCCGIAPAELRVIAQAAMNAAVDALQALDPDMDADIDVPGAPHADTDGDTETSRRPDDDQMETAPPAAAPTAETTPSRPAGEPTPTTEVPAVSEQPTPAAETANTPAPTVIQLTAEQFQQLLGARPAPAAATESAPAPPAAPVEETEDQRVQRLVAEGIAAQRDQMLESLRAEVRHQGPARKGLTSAGVTETVDQDPEAARRTRNDALLDWVSNGRYSNDD
ncbi:hypothetical protein P3T35_003165 [Kitasatospora sp. GP30]|uniref:hypothetical protein n=1 Tax=Kitasatospora sp. GP30 TaxID=3035084 RepID=UPI000C707310|nr:hypothetical protein [Kitasatospora sp. GP30]MDH6141152.1 hypothetical protein [Kitasatospora sp. GP30]